MPKFNNKCFVHESFSEMYCKTKRTEDGDRIGQIFLYSRSSYRGCLVCIKSLFAEVVCKVRLDIGFLLVLRKWCAQSRLAIGF